MPDTGTEVVELVEKVVKQSNEQGAKVAQNVESVALRLVGPETVPLATDLMKTREEVDIVEAELDTHCAAAELARSKHNVALRKVCEERQKETEARKATRLQSYAIFAM